jgi:hypothetical protein
MQTGLRVRKRQRKYIRKKGRTLDDCVFDLNHVVVWIDFLEGVLHRVRHGRDLRNGAVQCHFIGAFEIRLRDGGNG